METGGNSDSCSGTSLFETGTIKKGWCMHVYTLMLLYTVSSSTKVGMIESRRSDAQGITGRCPTCNSLTTGEIQVCVHVS